MTVCSACLEYDRNLLSLSQLSAGSGIAAASDVCTSRLRFNDERERENGVARLSVSSSEVSSIVSGKTEKNGSSIS